jgi:hypothetical protein
VFYCVGGGGGGGSGIGRLAGCRGIISSTQWEEVSNSFFLYRVWIWVSISGCTAWSSSLWKWHFYPPIQPLNLPNSQFQEKMWPRFSAFLYERREAFLSIRRASLAHASACFATHIWMKWRVRTVCYLFGYSCWQLASLAMRLFGSDIF